MARPIAHDKNEVLEKALSVFWMKGFEGTSVSDLVEATGLTTRSMYNVFGSKNGLFRAVLEKYFDIVAKNPFERLQKGTGLASVQDYILTLTSAKPVNGCLFVNTLSEKNLIEQSCLERVKAHFQRVELVLEEKFQFAVENEGYRGDPAIRARSAVVFLQGVAVYSKTGLSVSEIRDMGHDYLESIGLGGSKNKLKNGERNGKSN